MIKEMRARGMEVLTMLAGMENPTVRLKEN